MAQARTYLDYNATAPIRPEARAAMLAALDLIGNPSSVHAEGRQARAIVEAAREKVARLVNCDPQGIVFTSGATEANNWIIAGGDDKWPDLVVHCVEHDSVYEPASRQRVKHILSPRREGILSRVRDDIAERASRPVTGPMLIALQLANNETGVLNPVAEVTALAEAAEAVWVHTDAVQAAGRVPIDFKALGVYSMTLSSHKLGGPKGVGALVGRLPYGYWPFLVGGGQEGGLRAGTENVAGIAGFGAAAEAAQRDLADMPRIAAMRDRLEREAKAITPETYVVGADQPRLPNTSCIADPWRKAENMVIAFDLAGVAVSAGAACSSGKVGKSRVLKEMALPRGVADSAIRVSLGWNTTDDDIDSFLAAWASVTAQGRSPVARPLGPRITVVE